MEQVATQGISSHRPHSVSLPIPHSRFAALCAALLLSLCASPVIAQAKQSYQTMVVVLDYYGFRGFDRSGNGIYGVKVLQGSNFYYVELRSPMPCLHHHINESVPVRLCHDSNRWHSVTFEGRTAAIYRILDLGGNVSRGHTWKPPVIDEEDASPGPGWSPFYYDD